MRNICKMKLEDIHKEINYAIANKIVTHFTVLGDTGMGIIDYLETEHNLHQYTDGEEEFYDLESNVVYLISVCPEEYYIQEAYYQYENGEVLASYGNEDEIAYIEIGANLTTKDIQRIFCGNIILFEVDNELDCKLTKTDKEEPCEYISKSTYIVNDKEVDKETYDKKCKEFKEKFNKFENLFNTMLDDLLKSYL